MTTKYMRAGLLLKNNPDLLTIRFKNARAYYKHKESLALFYSHFLMFNKYLINNNNIINISPQCS